MRAWTDPASKVKGKSLLGKGGANCDAWLPKLEARLALQEMRAWSWSLSVGVGSWSGLLEISRVSPQTQCQLAIEMLEFAAT